MINHTLLEKGFPLKRLHKLALNEGNSKRPIYQIHKWWARRSGSVFRTILISSFLSTHESYHNFWAKYYNGFSLKNTVIYDPMMGGGTSIVEGLKLGCKVIGSDINPVAWFVTKKEIEKFDENKTDDYFNFLEQIVGNKIKKYYETTCLKGHRCDSVYSLWIRQIKCKKCKKRCDLFSTLIIRHLKNDDVVVCPKCNNIFHSNYQKNVVKCNLCKINFDIKKSVVYKGIFTCPSCGLEERIVNNIERTKKPLQTRMFCIEYDCKKCGRDFKSPDKNDYEIYEKARKAFSSYKKYLSFPKQRIPDDNSDRRPISHGFLYYHQLFNPRQLLSLSLLLKEIKKISDENIKEFLLLAFSSSLETNNVLCKYETGWGKISALFGVPAYHVPERYGENNLWGIGRGSFPRTYLKLKRGKKYAQNTYEVLHEIKIKKTVNKKKFTGESVITSINKKYSEFHLPGQKAQLFCCDSGMMKMIKQKSVDTIITDPPYFDTIQYSRLADFFYVWLRLSLKDYYPWFKPRTSKRDNEIVVKEDSNNIEDFVNGLTKILIECKRILKDNGMLIFTFHHAKQWAWFGLKKAINDSGFHVTAAPIIRSEGRTGFKKGDYQSYDVCVVCKKLEQCDDLSTLKQSIPLGIHMKTIKTLEKLDGGIKNADIFTVIMSKYLTTNNSTAEQIMNDSKILVKQIEKKTKY